MNQSDSPWNPKIDVNWYVAQMEGKAGNQENFYGGKITGDILTVLLGIYGAKGGIEIAIGSAGAAGLLTVGTGGAAAEISVPAGITGVVAGIGTTVVGLEGAAIAAGNLGSDLAMMQGSGKEDSETPKKTARQTDEEAKELGYSKTNDTSHGQPVYKKGNKYITPDVDSHNGGSWKMADSAKNLGSKTTRRGTYNSNLKRIGD